MEETKTNQNVKGALHALLTFPETNQINIKSSYSPGKFAVTISCIKNTVFSSLDASYLFLSLEQFVLMLNTSDAKDTVMDSFMRKSSYIDLFLLHNQMVVSVSMETHVL